MNPSLSMKNNKAAPIGLGPVSATTVTLTFQKNFRDKKDGADKT
jgi:hypothetical protein